MRVDDQFKTSWWGARAIGGQCHVGHHCACTMVRHDLVLEAKVVAGVTIRLRCAHGDTVTYPLAAVRLKIDGISVPVTAAVAKRLPASILMSYTNVCHRQCEPMSGRKKKR